MSARLRSLALLAVSAATTLTVGSASAHAATAASTSTATPQQQVVLKGTTLASYFWDDSSGRAGDTGLPAAGKPMQKGLVASPSWPLMTEGYVIYQGKKLPFFVGDRGPGTPSNRGVMLDLDAKTFAELTGGTFNSETLSVDGVGGNGHIKIEYVVTKWGDGTGAKGLPVAYSTGAWAQKDHTVEAQPVSVKRPAE
ncbi:hypothetical protein [Nonomuraea antimicrobica]|uniref:hypothetical protein n=1 Tax=Nonomuraea antimicrobica TaxID=561173 RepID=UPI0031F1579D